MTTPNTTAPSPLPDQTTSTRFGHDVEAADRVRAAYAEAKRAKQHAERALRQAELTLENIEVFATIHGILLENIPAPVGPTLG